MTEFTAVSYNQERWACYPENATIAQSDGEACPAAFPAAFPAALPWWEEDQNGSTRPFQSFHSDIVELSITLDRLALG